MFYSIFSCFCFFQEKCHVQVHQDQENQQKQQVPVAQLLSDQQQAHLESLQSLGSIGIQALPDKYTEPVISSTSGLFKQLRFKYHHEQ